MLSELSIPKKQKKEAALDYKQLYSIGLSHIQKLSNRIWTDYNVHDPGITTLELLCFALTDLGYRASFPIKDLLATKENNAANMASDFFSARKILTNRPLTIHDFRKFIIDLKGIKNAWIESCPRTFFADTFSGKLLREKPDLEGIEEVNISGLFNVLIDFDDTVNSKFLKEELLGTVKRSLMANRNLCEDFVSFSGVETQYFNLCCELEIAPDADASRIKARLYHCIQHYLAPAVKFYSLSQILEKKKSDGTTYTVDEVFDGPALNSGFIDDEELDAAQLRTEIRLSDIISIVMDIDGVVAVREIRIGPQTADPEELVQPIENKWVVKIEPGKKALLSPEILSDVNTGIKFYKRNMPLQADFTKVWQELETLMESDINTIADDEIHDFPIPLGSFRETGTYYSFQNHFPALYGLSEAGLDSGADEKRKALAYQFKAYLLFFDQIMADYFAQLANIRQLFSTDPAVKQTYFHQVVDSFTDFKKIYEAENAMDSISESDVSEEQQLERRNRFLDHLISRFAEQFTDFANIMYSVFGADTEKMIQLKCDFLQAYPLISSERSLAYNYSLQKEESLWNSLNISGFEKRISKLLGISDYSRRNLARLPFELYCEFDKTPFDEFRFKIKNRATGKILLSSSTNYESHEKAWEEMKKTIHFASFPSAYQRKITKPKDEEPGRYYFNILNPAGEVIARRIEYFSGETKMNKAIDDVITYLTENFDTEGMFLIENILLLPSEKKDPFLPICRAQDMVSCSGNDPYSYRLHIILPAFAGRFRNKDFRNFAEQLIREETPAHILPKICWISREDMSVLEKSYKEWIMLKAEVDMTNRTEKLKEFIQALFEVKNTYPTQLIAECESENPKFILGQTTLGSFDSKSI
jgi:hypothetical protein